MSDIVIASAVRTPIGAFNGAFTGLTAHQLGTVAVQAALSRAGIAPTDVSEVVLGQILTAAERLFAEHGVFAVSNRQVSEAAGQGNNAAVGYHFGTKTDLVRAIEQKHRASIERLLEGMVADIGDSAELRDWITCMVCSLTEHLAQLGNPTTYARFAAQALLNVGQLQDAQRLAVHPVHDGAGGGSRSEQPVPRRHFESRQAGFRDGRNIRRQRSPLARRDSDRFQSAAALDLRQR